MSLDLCLTYTGRNILNFCKLSFIIVLRGSPRPWGSKRGKCKKGCLSDLFNFQEQSDLFDCSQGAIILSVHSIFFLFFTFKTNSSWINTELKINLGFRFYLKMIPCLIVMRSKCYQFVSEDGGFVLLTSFIVLFNLFYLTSSNYSNVYFGLFAKGTQ